MSYIIVCYSFENRPVSQIIACSFNIFASNFTNVGGYWLPFWRPSTLTNLKKCCFEPVTKSLHGPDLDK